MIRLLLIFSIFFSLQCSSTYAQSDHDLFTKTLESGLNYFKNAQKVQKTLFPIHVYGKDFDSAMEFLNSALDCNAGQCSSLQRPLRETSLLNDRQSIDNYISDNSYPNAYAYLLTPSWHMKLAFENSGWLRNKAYYDYFKNELVWGDIFFAYKLLLHSTDKTDFFESQLIKFAVLADRLDELYLWLRDWRRR